MEIVATTSNHNTLMKNNRYEISYNSGTIQQELNATINRIQDSIATTPQERTGGTYASRTYKNYINIH